MTWLPPPLRTELTGLTGPAWSANLGRAPLVLLSGMLGDHTLWAQVAPLLNECCVPCPIRIDLDDSVTELAASVLAQAPPRFWLAGHSLGGIVALEVQRQAPGRVAGLALIAASARGPSLEQLRFWDELAERVRAGGFDRVADELADATLPPGASAVLRTANRVMADGVGPAGLLRQLAAQATRVDRLNSLAALDIPVLVVGGELDQTCPLPRQREIAASCPTATLIELAGAAHMLPLEAPEALASALRGWLQ
ncbi:MAG TPA: alpha/beta hydrolase [Jatrophihabitans sp.]|nr:alpha/beta hydrolase [Jatrophihabitans sp.]